ncbi:MAG: hypothetical protein H7Z12_19695 [Rhodospirillaceae bacterium]|nr:hypothetical protein [Rhodospirillales bacterium]
MRNTRVMIAAMALVAFPLMANAADQTDPTFGGLLSELRCTTKLDTYGYALDGVPHVWMDDGRNGATDRAYTVKMTDRTISGHAFNVSRITNRTSYKEVRLTVGESEYAISIIGDATAPGAEIAIEVKSHPQAQGQSLRSGLCQPI